METHEKISKHGWNWLEGTSRGNRSLLLVGCGDLLASPSCANVAPSSRVISLGITLRNALSPLAGIGTPWEQTLRSFEGEIHIFFPRLFAFRGSKEPGRCKFSWICMEQQLLEVISSGGNWHGAPAWACQSQNKRLILTNIYGMPTTWQTLYWVINAWGTFTCFPAPTTADSHWNHAFKNKR